MRIIAALFALIAGSAAAQTQSDGVINAELAAERDSWVAGAIITLGGSADRDLWVAGADLDIATDVGEDLWAGGANVTVRGDVGGALRAAGANVHVTSESEEATLAGATVEFSGFTRTDLQAGGARVIIHEDGRVARDSELGGAVVTIDGEIGRDLKLVGEEVILSGRIGGKAEILAERLVIREGARIDGDLDYSGPVAPNIPDGVVGGEITTTIRDFEFDDERTGVFMGLDVSELVGRIATVLSALAAGALIALIFPGAVRRVTEEGRRRPFLSAIAGLGSLILIPVLSVILIMTVIGLPFGVVALLAYPFVMFLGYVMGAFTLGSQFVGRSQDKPGFAPLALGLLAALVIAFAAGFIPIIGGLVGLILLAWGLGAMTLAVMRQPRNA